MVLPDDLFDFSYFFDLYQSMRELAQMAIPETWKFHSPQTPTYNDETPILEKYIRSLYRYLAISYNTASSQSEKNRYFSMSGPWACFHTGLMTPYFESIYALFELNRRRDTRYNWVFKSFCPTSSVKLRGLSLLPDKPVFNHENRYHPEWEVRINYHHILQDGANLGRIAEKLSELSPQAVREANEKMKARISELLAGVPCDESRLLTECAVFADKTDVTEELVRLSSHFSQLDTMLAETAPVGRKLDFLVQELNREINTIGSKCSGTEMTSLVIEAKSEIEKIREQIQNIE